MLTTTRATWIPTLHMLSQLSPTAKLQMTVGDVGHWCSSRRLQLNPKKAEITWFGTSANLAKLNIDDMQLHLDTDIIEPATVIRDLGVYYCIWTVNFQCANILHVSPETVLPTSADPIHKSSTRT